MAEECEPFFTTPRDRKSLQTETFLQTNEIENATPLPAGE
jgi:hypothetical protein